jgi:hypothetical protein
MNMTRKTTKDIDYEVSTGNVYADLGFADAGEMLAKARIVAQIGRIIQARKLVPDAYSDENRHPFQSNVGHYFQRKPCHLFRLNHSQSFHSKVGH